MVVEGSTRRPGPDPRVHGPAPRLAGRPGCSPGWPATTSRPATPGCPHSRCGSTSRRRSSPWTSRRTGSRSTCSSCSTSCSPCGWCRWDRRSPSRPTARPGVRQGPEGRTLRGRGLATWAKVARVADRAVLPLAGAGDGDGLPLLVVSPVGCRSQRLQRRAAPGPSGPARPGASTCSRPTSGTARFQNWQSEFLAVGSMVVFSIYLRERGSPESKPVGSPHDATGIEG